MGKTAVARAAGRFSRGVGLGIFLACVPLLAEAAPYIQGTVTLDGVPYTGSASVYLYCNGSNWQYASDWGSTTSDGTYSFLASEDSYNPCSSTYSSADWTSCSIYAYQWQDSDIANSDTVTVDLDCDSTLTQDLAFRSKDKTIALTLRSGNTAIVEGMSAYCSQTASPYTYSYTSEAEDDGTYEMQVIEGTYTCSAYCDYTYWYNAGTSCPYGGYPQTTVTVAASDTEVAATLSFETKDKTISVAVTAGGDPVTEDLTVYCSQQSSPYTYSSVSSASNDGTYDCLVTEGYYYVSAYCSTWPCEWSGYPSTYVTVGENDTTVDASLAFTVKDKTIDVTLMAGSSQITSDMQVYCSEQGGSWAYAYDSEASNGIYTIEVGTGTYNCSAYCTNWSGGCTASGYPNATVTVEEADRAIDLTLTFLENNATISGAVTGGGGGIGNLWLNISAYQVTSETGGVAATVGAGRIKQAVISGGTADSTQVYASAQTSSNGSFEARVPPGIYKVCAWPPYDRPTLASACSTVTATANATTVVALDLPEKTSAISGTVTDANGTGVASAYVSGWTSNGVTGTSDYFWASTDSDGAYTVYAVEGLTYNVNAYVSTWGTSSTLCNYSNEGMQAVTANDGTQTLNFTFPSCNCTMTVQAVDSDGEVVSSLYSSVEAKPTSFSSSEYYYGIWGYMSGGTTTFNVEEDREYSISLWTWGGDYTPGDAVVATCSDGSGIAEVSLRQVIDDAVTGTYVDGDGVAVTVDSATYINVYASNGRLYQSCETTGSGFSCNLSEGTWDLGYWVNSASGYSSGPAGTTTSSVTVTSAGGVSQNIELLRTGTISVTVLNYDGSGRVDVWAEATPYCAEDEGANDYQYAYGSGWCRTDLDGTCEIDVGAAASGTAYCVNAYIPYEMKTDESVNNPQEVEVTVVQGETVDAALAFTQPDSSVTITVSEGSLSADTSAMQLNARTLGKELPRFKAVVNADESDASSPAAFATVDCFSSQGGSFETTTDESGSASCPCTSSDSWYAVVHNTVSNALYISAVTPVTCTAGSATSTAIPIDYVTTVPEGKSQTVTDAAQAVTITLSDDFSVSFPPGALGDSGETVTVNVDVVMTPFTANRMPASFYAYSVNAFDGNNASITQLNSDASFNMPCDETQVANLGLDTASLETTYFDSTTGAYAPITNAVMDGESCQVSFTQDHLTEFVVVGNGNLGAVQGTDGGELGTEGDDEGGDSGGGDDGGETGGSASSGGGDGGCSLNPLLE